MPAERLPRVDVRQMDLGRRQTDGLERVEQGDGRVRIGGGIDDEAVKHAVGLLHPRHKLTLKIALPDRDRGPRPPVPPRG